MFRRAENSFVSLVYEYTRTFQLAQPGLLGWQTYGHQADEIVKINNYTELYSYHMLCKWLDSYWYLLLKSPFEVLSLKCFS